MTGPFLGIFQELRGCISRKKRSVITEKSHNIMSYISGLMCLCSELILTASTRSTSQKTVLSTSVK